ncbi:MAG: hypothetical protein WCR67_04340, partial [Bacilli bacterium]
RHIGGHEVYGAIHGQEYGDSTFECPDEVTIANTLYKLITDKDLLIHMTYQIESLNQQKYYDGGYEAVKLAVSGKKQ